MAKGQWGLAPHLAVLNRKLVQVALGECPRLMVEMPPRHGKSEMVSHHFPPWFLGHFPDRRVILTSYEADFAATWGRKSRDVLEEFGQELFGIKISADSSAANRWDIAGHTGGMITAGVGGPITGRGGHLIIIDDPVKNWEEARSQAMREKAWDWYRSTLRTRLEPGGAIVLVLTRWHEDDLAGRILADGSEPWEVIEFPAIAKEHDILGRKPGDALWPARYDEAALELTRKTSGPMVWSALYQQSPSPDDGLLFTREGTRYFRIAGDHFQLHQLNGADLMVPLEECTRFATVDLALTLKETSDYSVIAMWAMTRSHQLILMDLVRQRLEGPDQGPLIRQMFDRYKPGFIAVESAMHGLAIIQELRRQGLPMRELKAKGDKYARAQNSAAKWAAGDIYLPENASWVPDLIEELVVFPNGVHDDMVDAVAYAGIQATTSTVGGWQDYLRSRRTTPTNGAAA